MGNFPCAIQPDYSHLSNNPKSQFCIQDKSSHHFELSPDENVPEDSSELGQSPSTKFDINFLNSQVSASGSVQEECCQEKYSGAMNKISMSKGREKVMSGLSEVSKEWIKKIFEQVVIDKEKSESGGIYRERKETLKKYEDFLQRKYSKQSVQLLNIRFSGDIFYKIRYQSIAPFYQVKQKIGEGSFGSVYKGKCQKTGNLRAIKILKKKAMNKLDEKTLIKEINLIKKMDHVNIIKLYDIFYYKCFFYVVTEYCEGGSLFQALQNNLIRTQREKSMIIKQIISAVSYMHQLKVAHRDLKLQNIVIVKQILKSKQQNQSIRVKIIDFGLAEETSFQFRNKTGQVGTLQYMAPQIFSGFYSCHSDIWSCGVIMCLLLTGINPFRKKGMPETRRSIQEDKINFKILDPSCKINKKAQQLMMGMLQKKPEKRLTAEDILNHPWVKESSLVQNETLQSNIVVKNFKQFNRGNNFLCLVKNFFISKHLSQEVRHEMSLIFSSIDTDGSGVIDKQQLITLYSLINGTTDSQIQTIINKIDQNKSGKVDFQEFLLCMTESSITQNQQYINQAFDQLDMDHTGYLQKKQLEECIYGNQESDIIKILKQLDFNGDGKISRDQFVNYIATISL